MRIKLLIDTSDVSKNSLIPFPVQETRRAHAVRLCLDQPEKNDGPSERQAQIIWLQELHSETKRGSVPTMTFVPVHCIRAAPREDRLVDASPRVE